MNILVHYSPAIRVCRILTAIWSVSCPVLCRYNANTQLRPVLTKFCSPQPYGSTRSLSRSKGDIMSPVGVGRVRRRVEGKDNSWRND